MNLYKKAIAAVFVLMTIFAVSCGGPTESIPTTDAPSETVTTEDVRDTETAPEETAASEATTELPAKSEIDIIMEGMTLEEKVCQLFIIRPEALDFSLTPRQVNDAYDYGMTELSSEAADTLARYPVGGIVLFGKNVVSPGQLETFTSALQKDREIPPLIGIDEEGGSVARIAGKPSFGVQGYPDMFDIGQTGNPDNAYSAGLNIGEYLIKYGINADFAPVADVFTNPENKVIGKRAFGSQPNTVADMAGAFISGLHDAGVMSCAKHYPGHGDTKEDTHEGYASTDRTWDEMKERELIPFEEAISRGTDMIMAAHITAVNASSDGLPASLSRELITEKLRGELGYDGVIITDSMSMGAIIKSYTPEQAAVMAIQAGEDMICIPEDFRKALDGIINAVNDGTITEERIDGSVRRILELKQRRGMLG